MVAGSGSFVSFMDGWSRTSLLTLAANTKAVAAFF